MFGGERPLFKYDVTFLPKSMIYEEVPAIKGAASLSISWKACWVVLKSSYMFGIPSAGKNHTDSALWNVQQVAFEMCKKTQHQTKPSNHQTTTWSYVCQTGFVVFV